MKKIMRLQGLDCANCARELEEAIQKIDEVESASVNFMTGKLILECSDELATEALKKVKKVIKSEEPDVEVEED